jgi:DNA invertase Pin-like site-specific DNA recombinase
MDQQKNYANNSGYFSIRKITDESVQIFSSDTLVVTKLDRSARTAEDGVNLIKELLSKGIKVHILNMGLVEDTSMGRFFLRILSAIAEFDRDMIVERLAERKATAKQNPDFHEGRPRKVTKKQVAHALQLLETSSNTQVEELTGISKSTLIRAKREVKGGNEMIAKKSLLDYQREYERIIHADQPKKDILLAGLMTEMERQFKIPMLRNEEWERENKKVIAMYRKLRITRTL